MIVSVRNLAKQAASAVGGAAVAGPGRKRSRERVVGRRQINPLVNIEENELDGIDH